MKLKGSEKQVKWAEDILNPFFKMLEKRHELKAEDYGDGEKGETKKQKADATWEKVIELLSAEDAGMIIENRHKLEVDEIGFSSWFLEFIMDYLDKNEVKKVGLRTIDLIRKRNLKNYSDSV